MNRLQKKCFIASAGLHSLLGLILLIGPAFVTPSKTAPDEMPILDFIPLKTVDSLMSGGGDPNAKPPPAPPQQRPPEPTPPPPPAAAEKPVERKPPKDPPPPPERHEESLEPSPRKKEPVKISLDKITRGGDTKSKAKAREDARERKRWEERRQKVLANIGNAVERIGSDLSGSTTVALKGPGGRGVPYANFLQAVKSVYARAWVVPDGVTDDSATTTASVTIARDGKVVRAYITRRSGDSGVDASVQATLDRVRHAAPLPDDAKEDRRTVTINFNVRAKRLAG